MFPILTLVPFLSLISLITASPTPIPSIDVVDSKREVHVLAGAPINSLVLKVEPESPVQCSNVSLSWGQGNAGSAPYRLQIGTGGYYANLTWLYDYTNITSTNITWSLPSPNASNITAGDILVFQLWDSTNTTTYSQNHLVQPGNLTTNGTCPYTSPEADYTTPIDVGADATSGGDVGYEAAADDSGSEVLSGEDNLVAGLIANFEKTIASSGQIDIRS
ncbi:hypothetical protein IAT40_006881 [Kwoniella sp. CBS 6097]